MPLIPIFAALFLVVALIVLMPLSLVLRYRAGTVRRRAYRWVATVNFVTIVLSAGFFLYVAAITNFWVPDAFRYSVFGLLGGCVLGVLGLALTRWEHTPRTLHYTPNRWLVLIITLAVSARLLYGIWRIWHGWRTAGSETGWVETAGIAGSLAIGALMLGYYVAFSAGVRWRLRQPGAT